MYGIRVSRAIDMTPFITIYGLSYRLWQHERKEREQTLKYRTNINWIYLHILVCNLLDTTSMYTYLLTAAHI